MVKLPSNIKYGPWSCIYEYTWSLPPCIFEYTACSADFTGVISALPPKTDIASLDTILPHGMVHTWVGKKVKCIVRQYAYLKVMLWYFSTYDELCQPEETIPHNTNTQLTSPPWWWSCLPLQQHGFNESTLLEGRAALRIYCPRLPTKHFVVFIQLI